MAGWGTTVLMSQFGSGWSVADVPPFCRKATFVEHPLGPLMPCSATHDYERIAHPVLQFLRSEVTIINSFRKSYASRAFDSLLR